MLESMARRAFSSACARAAASFLATPASTVGNAAASPILPSVGSGREDFRRRLEAVAGSPDASSPCFFGFRACTSPPRPVEAPVGGVVGGHRRGGRRCWLCRRGSRARLSRRRLRNRWPARRRALDGLRTKNPITAAAAATRPRPMKSGAFEAAWPPAPARHRPGAKSRIGAGISSGGHLAIGDDRHGAVGVDDLDVAAGRRRLLLVRHQLHVGRGALDHRFHHRSGARATGVSVTRGGSTTTGAAATGSAAGAAETGSTTSGATISGSSSNSISGRAGAVAAPLSSVSARTRRRSLTGGAAGAEGFGATARAAGRCALFHRGAGFWLTVPSTGAAGAAASGRITRSCGATGRWPTRLRAGRCPDAVTAGLRAGAFCAAEAVTRSCAILKCGCDAMGSHFSARAWKISALAVTMPAATAAPNSSMEPRETSSPDSRRIRYMSSTRWLMYRA